MEIFLGGISTEGKDLNIAMMTSLDYKINAFMIKLRTPTSKEHILKGKFGGIN